ncbi:MAG TPA: VOC family protein [Terriglobales bacterium]
MINNRSVPANTILPHIVYQNVPEAIAWLKRAFGFSVHYTYGDPLNGAQMFLNEAWIMVRQARAAQTSPSSLGFGTQSLTIFVEDVEGQLRRAKTAGARIVEDLNETMYGELQFGVEDLEGHHWLFSRHARDVDPGEWGAVVVTKRF